MQSKAQIDQLLRQKSDAREIPGVVAVAATGNEVIYQGAFGKRDLAKDDAMTADSVFWIASMTKAITAAGAMQLVEQGKLSLDAPIGKVLPDLAAPQVFEGFDSNGEPNLRPAKCAITLRHLMTHTAGFAYDLWNGDMVRYLEKTGLPGITSGSSNPMCEVLHEVRNAPRVSALSVAADGLTRAFDAAANGVIRAESSMIGPTEPT